MDTLYNKYDFDRYSDAIRIPKDKALRPSSKGYLLLPFELKIPIEFFGLKIDKSTHIHLGSRYHAFASLVEIPSWTIAPEDAFLNLLSACLSFSFGMLVKPSFESKHYTLSSEIDKVKIGIHHPIEMHTGHINEEELKNGINRFYFLIEKLNQIKIKDYNNIIQSIRLIYLNYHSLYLDINLSYTLLVGSIENLGTNYIHRNDTALKTESLKLDEQETQLKYFCEENGIGDWFNMNILKNKKLKQKFVEFILHYAPFKRWYSLKERNPTDNVPPKGYEHLFPKDYFADEYVKARRIESGNFYPEEIGIEVIRKLLKNTYNSRSKFIHNGIGIPLVKDNSNRFFDWVIDYKTNRQTLTINYRTLELIARISIEELLSSITKKPHEL